MTRNATAFKGAMAGFTRSAKVPKTKVGLQSSTSTASSTGISGGRRLGARGSISAQIRDIENSTAV